MKIVKKGLNELLRGLRVFIPLWILCFIPFFIVGQSDPCLSIFEKILGPLAVSLELSIVLCPILCFTHEIIFGRWFRFTLLLFILFVPVCMILPAFSKAGGGSPPIMPWFIFCVFISWLIVLTGKALEEKKALEKNTQKNESTAITNPEPNPENDEKNAESKSDGEIVKSPKFGKLARESLVTGVAFVPVLILLLELWVLCPKGGGEGENFTIPLSDDVNLEMIWVKPGTFTDEDHRQISVAKGFWLGKFEVTQAQYQAIMGDIMEKEDDNLPVVIDNDGWRVSSFCSRGASFCSKLTEMEKTAGRLPRGYRYALPTTARWEYACRAGTTTDLNSGKNLTDEDVCPNMDEVGWYIGNSDNKTHPVGQKKPNAWGFYDMHGNVSEWCFPSGDYSSTIRYEDKGWFGLLLSVAQTFFPEEHRSHFRDSYVPQGGSVTDPANGCCVPAGYPWRFFDTITGFRVALVPEETFFGRFW